MKAFQLLLANLMFFVANLVEGDAKLIYCAGGFFCLACFAGMLLLDVAFRAKGSV